ncbi:class I SAM-dependent methyltransferase [Ancylobacter sonchi]|uniref:class I SAM-dependent methyltransferase n=1 Tax=Ancylobacter sonchi TaxID=1937790 RepID=UPI001BD32EC0|nr:class I SAM-dependent methyltransferase [Ancylobacter sonchi]MBS7534939.1 class I SAM-dependent methyltransferase [Ancylobacter sonchi]
MPFDFPPAQGLNDKSMQLLSYRLRVFDLILRELGDPAGRHYVDLGAGPLIFAQRALRHGFAVTAVDARPPWTGAVYEGIAHVLADVRDFPLDGFDVIGIVGLLYHLRLDEQVDLLRRCEGRPTIIDTEVWCPELVDALGLGSTRVQPAATTLGYSGATLQETRDLWSSFGNPDSFWLDEPGILRVFEESGWRSATLMEPPYFSRFGRRRWYLLR